MVGRMQQFREIIFRASRSANYLVIVTYLALALATLSTILDICLRYIFGKPIMGVIEFNECMMPLIVFSAVAVTQAEKGHIGVTLVLRHLPARVNRYLSLLTDALALGFMILMGILTWQDAMQSLARREAVMVGMQMLPIWWSKFSVPLGLWAMSLQCFSDLLVHLKEGRK